MPEEEGVPDVAPEAEESAPEEGTPEPAEGVESAEPGAGAEAEPSPEEPSLAELIMEGKAGEEMDALEQVLEEEGSKGYSVSREEFAALPDSAKKLLANMRRMAGSKSRAAADRAKEADAAIARAAEQERLAAEERVKISSIFETPEIKRLLEGALTDKGLDPYTPEGQKAAAEKGAAEYIKGIFEQVAESTRVVQEAYAAKQTRSELERFSAEHPDFESDELFPTIKELYAAGMDHEKAYRLAKGAHLMDKKKTEEAEAARGADLIGSARGTGGGVPLPAENATTEEVLAHFEAYPGSAEAMANKRRSGW